MTSPEPNKFIQPKDIFRKHHSKNTNKPPVYTLGRKIQIVPGELVSLIDGEIVAKEIPGEAHFVFSIGPNHSGYRRRHIISNGDHYYNVDWKYDYENEFGKWVIDTKSRYWRLDTNWQKLIKHVIQLEFENG